MTAHWVPEQGNGTQFRLAWWWFLLLTSALVFPAGAAVLGVEADGSGEYPTIQAAVNVAADGDSILLGDGIYTGDGNREIDLLGRIVTIASQSGVRETVVLDLGGAGRAFFVDVPTPRGSGPTLRDLSIRNGFREPGEGPASDGWGGALFIEDGASLDVENVVFDSNRASLQGGAIYLGHSANLTATNCLFSGNDTTPGEGLGGAIRADSLAFVEIYTTRFEGNYADKGGAVYLRDGDAYLFGCEFLGNEADLGGALYARGQSEPTLDGCTFIGNEATSRGAGFYSTDAGVVATLTDCLFLGNEVTGTGARTGGAAIYLLAGPNASIESCRITGNRVASVGGAAYVENAGLVITGSTIAGNRADERGGAIYGEGQDLLLERTILWGDCAALGGNEIFLADDGVASADCCLLDATQVTGNVLFTQSTEEDPLFCSPVSCEAAPTLGGDYGLQNGSPASADQSPCESRIGSETVSDCVPLCAPRDFITDASLPPETDPTLWDHDVLHVVGDLFGGERVYSVYGDAGAISCSVDRIVVLDGPSPLSSTELGTGLVDEDGSFPPIAIGSPNVDCVWVFVQQGFDYSAGTRLLFDRAYPTTEEHLPTPDPDFVHDPWNPYRVYDAGDFVNIRLLAVDPSVDCDEPGPPTEARNALLHVWADFSPIDRRAGSIPEFGTPADSILFTSLGADLVDNDGDWRGFSDLDGNGFWSEGEPLNDDLGLDGIANTGDAGEGDGLPTFGDPYVDEDASGSFEPGETFLNRFVAIDGSLGDLRFDPGEPRLDSNDPDEFGWYEIRSTSDALRGTVEQGFELVDPDPAAAGSPSVAIPIHISDNGIDGLERPGALDRELPFLDSIPDQNRSLSQLTILDGSDPERGFVAVLDLDAPDPGSLVYLANEPGPGEDGAPGLEPGTGDIYGLSRFVDFTLEAASGDPVLYARARLNPGSAGWVDLALDPGPDSGSPSDANGDGFPGGADFDEDDDAVASQSNGFDDDEDGVPDDLGGGSEDDGPEGVDFGDREVHAAGQSAEDDLLAPFGNGLHAENDYTDNDNDAFFVYDSYANEGADSGVGRIFWYNVDESRTNLFDDDNDGEVDELDEESENVGYGGGENDDDEDGIADGEAVLVPIDTSWSVLAIAASPDPDHDPVAPGPGVDGTRIRVDASHILGVRPRGGPDARTEPFYANELAYGEVVPPGHALLTTSVRTFPGFGYRSDALVDSSTSASLNFRETAGRNFDLLRVAEIYDLATDGIVVHELGFEGSDLVGNVRTDWLSPIRFTLDFLAPLALIPGCDESGDPPPDFGDVDLLAPGIQIYDAGLHPEDYELTAILPRPEDEDAVSVTFEASFDPDFETVDYSVFDDSEPFNALWPGGGMFTVDNFPAGGTRTVYFRARATDELGNTTDEADLCVLTVEVLDGTAPTATLFRVGDDTDLSDGAQVYLDSTVVLAADLDDRDGVGWVVGSDLATGEAGLDDDADGSTDEDDVDGDGRFTEGVDDPGGDGVPGTDDDEWNGSSRSENLGATDDFVTDDIASVQFEYDQLEDSPDGGWVPISLLSEGPFGDSVTVEWNTEGLDAGDYLLRAWALDVEGNSGRADALQVTVGLAPIVQGACCLGEICSFGPEAECAAQEGVFFPNVPCDPSPCISGACCLDEECTLVTEADCFGVEGSFFAGAACDPSPCLLGACCLGAECSVVSEADCGEGVFRAGESCSPNPCTLGACCEAEVCTLRPRGECEDRGGSFVLAGSCDPDPCNSGACCLSSSCSITSARECAEQDGDFLPGDSCDPDPCVLGACCQDEVCSVVTRSDCEDLTGSFFEDGGCDPSPCDLGACCLPDGCTLTTESLCMEAGAAFFTDDLCEPSPCTIGACCTDDGCTSTSEAECLRGDGEFFGGAPCDPDPCDAGACCVGETCTVGSQAECLVSDGTYFPGESCDPNPCVFGACCVDASCSSLSRWDCEQRSGTFLEETSCDPDPCGSGACCLGEECTISSALGCVESGGSFTSEGVCDPNPCEVGACCEDEACSLRTRADCLDLGGEFRGNESCDPSPCDLGACCEGDLCSVVTALVCADRGGAFFGEGECEPNPCITGACCIDEACSPTSETSCLESGGVFLAGEVCDPNPCVLGACCVGDDCVFLSETACAGQGGAFLGDVECSPSPCLSGACCEDLSCAVVTEAECSSLEGRFFPSVTCDPSPCVTGACCSDTGCAVGTESDCVGAEGEFYAGALCTPSPCVSAACCLEKECRIVSEAECVTSGGQFLLGRTCDPNPCEEGACCLAEMCSFGSRAECEESGGAFHVDLPCDPSPCITGACCFGESCSPGTEADCAEVGGDFFVDSTCDPNPCLTGACCLETDCSVGRYGDCVRTGGDPLPGEVCEPSPCLDGACCVSEACTFMSQAGCVGSGGDFFARLPCDPSPCLSGACCLGEECRTLSPADCAEQSGTFLLDAPCDPSPCLEGACCAGDDCGIATEADCAAGSGSFFPDEGCDPSPCRSGACCFGETCEVASEARCLEEGGGFSPGAGCDPSPCLLGACCVGSQCSTGTEADCEAAGGDFRAGEGCDPDPCLPNGSCCFEDGSCSLLTEADCGVVFGVIWDPNGVCDPSPCRPVIGDVDIVADDDDVFWEVESTPQAEVAELTGWFRRGGESVYRQVTGFERVGDSWIASFAPEDRGVRGIEYYLDYRLAGDVAFRSFGSANDPRRLTFEGALPVPLPRAYGLRMISAPVEPGNPNVHDLLTTQLGPPSGESWIMAYWSPSDAGELASQYVYLSEERPNAWDPGRGYWLGIADGSPDWTLTGTTRFPAAGGTEFLVPLSPGWNLVGNPAAYAVTLDPNELRVGDGETIVTFAERFGGESDLIYVYAPLRDPESPYQVGPSALAMWEACWIENPTPSALTLRIPAAEAGALAASATLPEVAVGMKTASRPTPDALFGLSLTARSGGERRDVSIGLLPTSSRLRRTVPAYPGQMLHLGLVGPDAGLDDEDSMDSQPEDGYRVDWRQERDRSETWSVFVESMEEPIELSWSLQTASGGDGDWAVTLESPSLGRAWFADELRSLELPPGRHELLVRADSFEGPRSQDLALELLVDPNPVRTTTVVTFRIPVDSEVGLQLYDVAGHRVWDMPVRSLGAGEHAVFWEGRDREGARLPAGAYFVQLEVRSPGGTVAETKKIVLLR